MFLPNVFIKSSNPFLLWKFAMFLIGSILIKEKSQKGKNGGVSLYRSSEAGAVLLKHMNMSVQETLNFI